MPKLLGRVQHSIVLPSATSMSIAPLTSTFAITTTINGTEGWTPYTAGTVTPDVAASTPTYSLVGDQAVGFDVVNSGNNAVIRVTSRRDLLDNGIRTKSYKTRVFILRAAIGAFTSDCTVTVTLDTSSYGAFANNILGIDVTTGRTSTNTMGTGTPPGWTATPSAGYTRLVPNSDGVTLTDWDLRNYWLYLGGRKNITLNQCLLGVTSNMKLPTPQDSVIRCDSTGAFALSLTNCTIDMNSSTVQIGGKGFRGSLGTVSKLAVLGAQGDAGNCDSITGTDVYLSSSCFGKYNAAGAPITDGSPIGWDHADGIQSWSPVTDVSFDGIFFYDVGQPYIDGVTPLDVGTATFALNSRTVVGTGTTWDSSMVGQCIRLTGMSVNHVVTNVADNTHLTIGTIASGGFIQAGSGPCKMITFAQAMAGVNSPAYLQGVVAGGPALSYPMTAQNGIALGGATALNSHSYASDGVQTNALIKWKNLGMGDYLYAPYPSATPTPANTNFATTATVQGCVNVLTGASIQDARPVPTAPAFTQGATTATTITLVYTSQDPTITYEYNLDGGAYADVPSDKVIRSLTTGTAYNIGLRGKNCLATDGTYLQVGSATNHTFSTS